MRVCANCTVISIHALREESDLQKPHFFSIRAISIHALREESDRPPVTADVATTTISIHALREESDIMLEAMEHEKNISIHALREESDRLSGDVTPKCANFYPRSP